MNPKGGDLWLFSFELIIEKRREVCYNAKK